MNKVAKSVQYVEPICWVYIPQNPAGKFYVGESEDLDARVNFHNQTNNIDGHFNLKNMPWKLIHFCVG